MIKEKNLAIYTVTIIRVMTDEACEYKTVPFTDRDKAIKFYDESSMKWLREKKEFEKAHHDPDFNVEDWYNENIYEEIDDDNYKLIHLVFDEGEEKIFELKSHEVTE